MADNVRRRRDADPEALIASARGGDARALGRLVSLVENRSPELRAVMKAIAPLTGNARVIGLTGSPGVGKSTVTAALVTAYRAAGLRIAVLAVDPTSPFTGGALLGDRVRMQGHATDDGVFIRSMASRGQLGGLSWATPQALRIMDAAGFDLILVETVGVGQAELEIAGLADSTLVIVAPGMGDSIQAAKAGILEIADLFVVNKSDRPGAQETVRDLRTMLAMGEWPPGRWKPLIVSTAATTATGIDDLTAGLDEHWSWLGSSGQLAGRRRARAREEVAAIAVTVMRERMGALPGDARLDELAGRVASGEIDPYAAADELVSG
ncbi:MAG: methylmalonyl Co-A mutase-associated GTPase MeaB [Actinomycetota bacterium]